MGISQSSHLNPIPDITGTFFDGGAGERFNVLVDLNKNGVNREQSK
jgi:hypothetical protein